jgi:hypothetical protein
MNVRHGKKKKIEVHRLLSVPRKYAVFPGLQTEKHRALLTSLLEKMPEGCSIDISWNGDESDPYLTSRKIIRSHYGQSIVIYPYDLCGDLTDIVLGIKCLPTFHLTIRVLRNSEDSMMGVFRDMVTRPDV